MTSRPTVDETGELELVAIETLTPHPDNPRRGDLGAVRASIRAHGFVDSLVAQRSTRRILGGNHRWQAALAEGIARIPVLWVDCDDGEAEEILLVLNRTADRASYDKPALAALLARITESGRLPERAGWAAEDLRRFVTQIRGPEPLDEPPVPDLRPDPVTVPGQVWQLGKHRLLCGDARELGDYARLLGDDPVGCVWTDPPYGVGIGTKNALLNSVAPSARHTEELDGDANIDEVEPLWRAAFAAIEVTIPPGCPWYICGPQGGDLSLLLLLCLRDAKLNPRHILIWVKDRATFSLGRLDYEYQHEPVVYGWKPGAAHPWYATGGQHSSIIEAARPHRSEHHATMKPVELVEQTMLNNTQEGDIILDPFAGSGTTLIASEHHNRQARLIEIDPSYCDVIVSRWENLTGEKAVRT